MTSAQNAFQSVAFYILQQNNFHKFYRILFTLGLHFREKQALFLFSRNILAQNENFPRICFHQQLIKYICNNTDPLN